MTRKFYFHPNRRKQVGDAIITGALKATENQLVESIYMPLRTNDETEILGWWMETWEPADFLSFPKVPAEAFAFKHTLDEYTQRLCGAIPLPRKSV